MSADSPLPEFEKPPVSEVAMGVEFLPLANWRSPHAGLYWGRINKEYPQTEVQPPLPSQIEKFGEEFWAQPAFRVELANPDSNRSWFLADPATKLVQVQRDHFIINWRKVRGDEVYPRYLKEIRPRFEREWKHFCGFLVEQKIGTVSVQQCELTYVNDVLKDDGWSSFAEALTLFEPWWKRGSDGFLPIPETVTVMGSVQMPNQSGRLHFSAQHVRRTIDNREAIQLRLVARGRPLSGEDKDILNWMDLAHEWIVRGFTDLTSARAHKLWGRKS
jgi:uncharacterized protein (TIGR04255 family)